MRVKTGVTRRQNHKRLHKATKGYRMTKHKLVKVAKEALLHAGQYAFNGRRKKKGNFRKIWIQRISAGLEGSGMTYSAFVHALAQKNVTINRKMLADMALNEPETFAKVVEEAQSAAK